MTRQQNSDEVGGNGANAKWHGFRRQYLDTPYADHERKLYLARTSHSIDHREAQLFGAECYTDIAVNCRDVSEGEKLRLLGESASVCADIIGGERWVGGYIGAVQLPTEQPVYQGYILEGAVSRYDEILSLRIGAGYLQRYMKLHHTLMQKKRAKPEDKHLYKEVGDSIGRRTEILTLLALRSFTAHHEIDDWAAINATVRQDQAGSKRSADKKNLWDISVLSEKGRTIHRPAHKIQVKTSQPTEEIAESYREDIQIVHLAQLRLEDKEEECVSLSTLGSTVLKDFIASQHGKRQQSFDKRSAQLAELIGFY